MKLTSTRPTLSFVNDDDGEEIEIAFGYFGEERTPTAALFHGDDLVLIPVSVLAIALSSGWEDDYSMLCAALKDDSPCPNCADDDEQPLAGPRQRRHLHRPHVRGHLHHPTRGKK